jgi:hypothetical protein
VVGVEGEQHVQGMLEHRVGVVLGLPHLPHQVEEVAGVRQLVVGERVGVALGVAVGVGGQGGDLGDQPDNLTAAHGRVVDLLGVGVEGRQRPNRPDQDAHGVGVVVEAVDELLDVLLDEGVVVDLVGPVGQLPLVGQVALDQQPGHLQEADPFGQLLDRVAAVAQDPLVAVDVGDGAAAAGRVHERRVVGEQPEVVVGDLDVAQGHGRDGPLLDRDLVGPPGPVVGHAKRVLVGHGDPPRHSLSGGGGGAVEQPGDGPTGGPDGGHGPGQR